jgi:CRISPR/Cas system CSM-associated protein Csm2 small subunit
MNENNSENVNENIEVHRSKKGLYIGIACVVAAFAVVYFGISLYYLNHFFDNVYINGNNVSKMTVEDIRSELKDKAENYTLLVGERNGKEETI